MPDNSGRAAALNSGSPFLTSPKTTTLKLLKKIIDFLRDKLKQNEHENLQLLPVPSTQKLTSGCGFSGKF